MNPTLSRKLIPAMLLACGLAVASSGARAEIADLSDVPLANSPTDAVLPNLMYIMDDSGSMMWDYMPDNVHTTSSFTTIRNCKTSTGALVQCSNSPFSPSAPGVGADWGEPPFFAAQFNQIYYNPDITYAPAVDSTGLSLGDTSPTAAKKDAYLNATAVDLTTTYPEIYYCSTASPSAAQLANPANCRRNGVNNVSTTPYFLYWSMSTTNGGYPISGFTNRVVRNTSAPYYFTITPQEWCSDPNLINCQLANTDGSAPTGFPIPAPVRYCRTAAQAASTAAQSDAATTTTPKCRKKFSNTGTTYSVPRYGRFTRVDIVASTATYPKRPTAVRTDCASTTSCTYAEELQNFANWYSYYRTRMAMMKTATGRAFMPIDDRYRVGFITINPGNPVREKNVVASDPRYLQLRTYDATQRGDFYTILYAQTNHGGTPLRQALARVGRHYAGVTSGINSGMSTDPVTHSCQQHFALLTTDGYWNDAATSAIDTAGAQVGDQDSTPSTGTPVFVSRATGTLDGTSTANTLADVAMYYYKTDLRTGTPTTISDNSTVKDSAKDVAKHQHMVTFTLGLGLQGLMDYVPDYESNPSSDFAKIKNADVNTCSWVTGTCNWPVPAGNQPSTLDDLWHAAVNGRGVYYSASDPNSLADGLSGALAALKTQTASASASATSSPNVTETDNFIYSSTFRTVKWDGEVEAQRIDPTNGTIVAGFAWRAQGLLDAKVSAASDSRQIWKFDSGAGNNIEPFLWANLSAGVGTTCTLASEQACFANKCTALSQCPLLTAPQQALADDGLNMVNWLRGQTQHEASIYRDRDHVLGDPANAQPAFVKAPRFSFNDSVTPTYGAFQSANASRQGVLYIAANDGMLHALNADTGAELWAYVPRIVFPSLHELATDNWDVRHKYTVDGSPQIMDVYHASASAWKTLLVAGLNKGGRGYYALDVTDPFNPKGLWELCSDPALCERSDADLGYSYGTPIIAKRAFDGRWVVLVSSGVNNVSPGTGRGYLYVLDAFTGAVLQKVEALDGAAGSSCVMIGFTLVCGSSGGTFGDTTTPSGFAKISAFANSPQIDNTALYVYGGDLFGNIWRFDMQVDPPAVLKIGELKDASGKPQSITTRPELSVVQNKRVLFIGTGRYLGEDDLVDGATLSPPLQWSYEHTIYAIKDKDAKYDNGAGSSNIRTSSPGLVQQVMTDNAGVRTITSNVVDWTNKDGWYIDLNPGNTSPGERVNLDPQLVLGTLIVVGNVPNNNACTVGGDSFIYQFDFDSGTAIASSPDGIVGQKKTGEITVGVVAVCLQSGQCKGIGTGAGGVKDSFGLNLGGSSGSGRRISWREVIQ